MAERTSISSAAFWGPVGRHEDSKKVLEESELFREMQLRVRNLRQALVHVRDFRDRHKFMNLLLPGLDPTSSLMFAAMNTLEQNLDGEVGLSETNIQRIKEAMSTFGYEIMSLEEKNRELYDIEYQIRKYRLLKELKDLKEQVGESFEPSN